MQAKIQAAIVSRVGGHFFYGWIIVAAASIGIFTSGPGQSHTFSVFVEPISADLGISKASIAIAYGLATLVAAFLLPQMGRFVDRYGPRRMLIVITALLGVACLLFGAAANILWLAFSFGALRFLGQGSLMLGCANLVSHWFSRDRGLAMSLMALGFSASMAVHPPLSQFLVQTIGWREAWLVLGVLTWLLMLPVLMLFVHDVPEDIGLQPDGRMGENANDAQDAAGPANDEPRIDGLSLREALRTVTFYILSAGWFAIAMLVTTLHFYQVSILTNQGVGAEVAARVFAVAAFAMLVAMPFVGRAFDLFRTRHMFAFGLLVTAASLISITFVETLFGAVLYAILFGINNAFSMTMFGYIWPRYFGRRHLGSIQGAGQMIGVVGASLGPLPVGVAFDLVGDATLTLQLLALYPIGAAIIAVLFLRTSSAVQGVGHLE